MIFYSSWVPLFFGHLLFMHVTRESESSLTDLNCVQSLEDKLCAPQLRSWVERAWHLKYQRKWYVIKAFPISQYCAVILLLCDKMLISLQVALFGGALFIIFGIQSLLSPVN